MSDFSVLIAEPSKTGRHIFTQLVSRLGVMVTFTETAHETVIEAARQRFNMICLSQKLPDDEGINVCAKLRKLEQYRAVMVLLVTPQKSAINYDYAFTNGVTQLIGRHELHRFVHALELMIERAKPIEGRVLVVEDSRAQAEYISVLLKSMGLEVVVVGTGEQAIEKLKVETFSMTMIDVVLAGAMTGVELVDYIRTLPEPKNRIRVLAMSAYEDPSRRIKLFNLGVDDFITKPLVREELVARVRGLLSQHHIVATNMENERLSRSLKQLLDNSPDVIARFNLTGELLFMNPRMAQELGVDKDALVGKHFSELGLSKQTVEVYQTAIKELIRSEQVVRYQLSGKNNVEFDMQFSPEFEDGKIVSFISSARDITSLNEQQKDLISSKQALELANDAKSRFLATMSHELRTPLNAIAGFTQLLKNKLNEPGVNKEEFAQFLQHIGENSVNLTNLIDDVLDLSRIEAGKLRSHLQSVDIHALLDGIKAGFSSACEGRKITLDIVIDGIESGLLVLDKAKTLTILNNLIDNAIKFSHYGGLVRVIVRQRDNLEVEVIDQGIGIPESFTDRLFAPFEQVDNSRTRDYGGTGLGLSIVHKFTQFLGGTIFITSVVNKGTNCHLSLPLGDPSEVAEQGESEQEAAQTQDSAIIAGQKVLVVEDSLVNQQLMKACLENLNLKVEIAQNGIEGIEKCLAWLPDIILMDMHMPKMDGMEACMRIRQHFAQDKLPIFALSADVHKDYIQKAFDSGINEYLTKPVDFDVLKRMMAQYLAKDNNINDKHQVADEGVNSMTEDKVLDVDKGIAFAANNAALFKQLLETFVNQYAQSAEQLSDLYQQANYDEAMKLAHTMKGVSSTLGMDSLSEVAKKMQFAFANQALDGIEELIAEYSRLLGCAIEQAKAYCAAA